MRSSLFAAPRVEACPQPDGSVLVRSTTPLFPYARAVSDWLETWARDAPDRIFLTEPSPEGRRALSYAEVSSSVRAIAQGLLDLGATPERPVMLLSDNAIDHALV